MYISYIKRLISNKWRQVMIRLSRKFYVQLFLTNKTQVIRKRFNYKELKK